MPPFFGVTPPTMLVPYAMACSLWKVPCFPVKPWQMTLVFLSIHTLAVALIDRAEMGGAAAASLQRTCTRRACGRRSKNNG